MTEQERKNLVVRVKSNKYLTRIETDYIADALEELQQYRALGTVSEIQGVYVEYIRHEPLYKQYNAIGTPDECRAAMEKQKAYNVKKVVEQIKCMSPANYVSKDDVLKIVKGGGVID